MEEGDSFVAKLNLHEDLHTHIDVSDPMQIAYYLVSADFIPENEAYLLFEKLYECDDIDAIVLAIKSDVLGPTARTKLIEKIAHSRCSKLALQALKETHHLSFQQKYMLAYVFEYNKDKKSAVEAVDTLVGSLDQRTLCLLLRTIGPKESPYIHGTREVL